MSAHYQEYRARVAAEFTRPDDGAVFALTAIEPTLAELNTVAKMMAVKKHTAEVYVEVVGAGGYYMPVAMRVDWKGDLIIVVDDVERAR